MSTPVQLANAFSAILRQWLDPIQLAAVVTANRSEYNPSICHSHDACDSNQAMIDALQSFGIDWNVDLCGLVNAAWDIAKRSEFQEAATP